MPPPIAEWIILPGVDDTTALCLFAWSLCNLCVRNFPNLSHFVCIHCLDICLPGYRYFVTFSIVCTSNYKLLETLYYLLTIIVMYIMYLQLKQYTILSSLLMLLTRFSLNSEEKIVLNSKEK